MAKLLFPLGLVTVLLSIILRPVLGVTLDQLFKVWPGVRNGGCDAYFDRGTKEGILDEWLEEINFALASAIDSIEQYNQSPRVRKALNVWFGIHNGGKLSDNDIETRAKVQWVSDRLQSVQEFFSFTIHEGDALAGQPYYPLNDDRYLFCGSDFLAEQATNTPAQDWLAKDLVDGDGNVVNIEAVPGYAEALAENRDSAAWWSGDLTEINGYYFSNTGGFYCDMGRTLGLTAVIGELEADITGNPTVRKRVESVVICPYCFAANNPSPNSFRIGSNGIASGTNLPDVLPKSATLLHEAFHVVFGVVLNAGDDNDRGFLQGDEFYDIIDCINEAKNNPEKRARRNPENYVFFVAHMFYLFGKDDDNIDHNWDFAPMGRGSNKIFGAKDQIR